MFHILLGMTFVGIFVGFLFNLGFDEFGVRVTHLRKYQKDNEPSASDKRSRISSFLIKSTELTEIIPEKITHPKTISKD